MINQREYSAFSQKYIELVDELNALEAELAEMGEEFPKDEEGNIYAPLELIRDIYYLKLRVEEMTRIGEQKFNKTGIQIVNDGWNFWFKEDMELREKRYGGQS